MSDAVPLHLSEPAALRIIREMAKDSAKIVVHGHAWKRQNERGISRRQIERCVQKGTITEGPFLNDHGNWQVTMYRHAAGEELTCIVAIEWAKNLLVISAF